MIRPANAADVADLFRVRTSVRENHLSIEQLEERGVTPASIAATLADDEWRTWVAEEHGTICGFTMASSKTGSVFALFISPEYEGRGYGSALLDKAERWLFESGREMIWLETDKDPSTRAHRLYQRSGWNLVGSADHGDVRYEKRRPSS
jgi:ribosomal protein S18 acetylase RimI-like enzyme